MNEPQFCRTVSGAVADYLWQELKIRPAKDYRVLSATSGPRVLTLGLVLNPRHAPRVIGMTEQLSMAAGLDREASVRVARGQRGTLTVEIPKPRHLWYNVQVKALPRRKGLKAPVGIDLDHRPALVDFGNPLTPHLLTAGATGCGKTNTARLLLYDLAMGNSPDEVQMLLIDTRKRGIAWRPFAGLPHLAHPVIIDDEEALRALGWACAEIDRRAANGRTRPRLFLSIDEAQALLEHEHFIGPIRDIAAVGREFGIHLLLATQNPTAQMLGDTSIKRNLSARLVGKVDSAQAAVVSSGLKGTGAELLTGPGDQLLVQPSGVTRITTALITDNDLAALPRQDIGRKSLDLDEYDDLDHVLDQAGTERRASLQAGHVATALVTERGINWLARELRVGTKRATRVKRFADDLRQALENLGYTIIPHTLVGTSAGVTGHTAADGV